MTGGPGSKTIRVNFVNKMRFSKPYQKLWKNDGSRGCCVHPRPTDVNGKIEGRSVFSVASEFYSINRVYCTADLLAEARKNKGAIPSVEKSVR